MTIMTNSSFYKSTSKMTLLTFHNLLGPSQTDQKSVKLLAAQMLNHTSSKYQKYFSMELNQLNLQYNAGCQIVKKKTKGNQRGAEKIEQLLRFWQLKK